MLTPVHFEQSDSFWAVHPALFHQLLFLLCRSLLICCFKVLVKISKKFFTLELVIPCHKTISFIPRKVFWDKFRDVIIDTVIWRYDYFFYWLHIKKFIGIFHVVWFIWDIILRVFFRQNMKWMFQMFFEIIQ